MCGTCGRQLLADCTCSFADRMRRDISRMLTEGKTKDQIIAWHLEKFPGESALAMPIDRGFNRLAWILPYTTFFAGAGLLVLAARRMTRKRPTATPAQGERPAGSSPKGHEDRLDDELGDLD